MITAVVMVENQPNDGITGWVQGARRAAATDLLLQLTRQERLDRLVFVSPEPLAEPIPRLDYYPSSPGPIHVGEWLARLAHAYDSDRLLYFGGGSAPLLSDEAIAQVIDQLAVAEELVFTNNQFASDWAGITPTSVLNQWLPRLERDNSLGWVLSHEAGLPVATLPVAAATRLDIDTPTDLLTLRLHPGARPRLRHYLDTLPLDTTPLQRAWQIMATPASRVFISGRIAPDVWQQLNRTTRAWFRVLSEERGMVSSGRQEAGQAHSLVAAHMEAVGLPRFFALLAEWADVAFIDTRVLFAHRGRWPEEADRFASDLGRDDEIQDTWLRQLTAEANQSPIPIILGGHSLLAGDMLAFCDLHRP